MGVPYRLLFGINVMSDNMELRKITFTDVREYPKITESIINEKGYSAHHNFIMIENVETGESKRIDYKTIFKFDVEDPVERLAIVDFWKEVWLTK